MSKTTANKKTASAAPSPAPISMKEEVAPAVTPMTAAPAESKAKRSKTAAAAAAPAVAVAAPAAAPAIKEEIATASAAAAEPVESTEAAFEKMSVEFSAKLNALSSMIAALKADYRKLTTSFTKDLKAAQKLSSKKKRKAGTRAPSGFVKPTKISDELAVFLGKEKGSEMARTDVTRAINTYIRSNDLQDKDNGRKINPDQKLATLLKLKKTDELTYFNLQKYMGIHFAKAPSATAAAASATA